MPPIEYSNRSVAALQKIHIAELLITSVVNQYSALCVVDYTTSIVEYMWALFAYVLEQVASLQ